MTTQPGTPAPAVQSTMPPAIVLKTGNPIFKALLRSPAHGLVGGAFLLLTFSGRKSGKQYTVVLGMHERDGVPYVVTSAPWRVNLRGGADVQVTSNGRTWNARAELNEEPESVAATYGSEIERIGWKGAQRRLGLKINVDRAPTHEELVDAVHRDHLSVIRLNAA